ncbi:dienelactone hydrolase family protein [Methylosinus sp. H3A]|uniref:dienelactone hydrolase family protein n=1 Tax=Methylosinus sp. H3A TaxID=2785786 RepID=UPI0018C28E94|nr:dienelactone hydrolase family protein [Methylosinus sp. H3A]MBG0809284.1 dienelactone hydrolase family protein [Methylosinus sp. H3A]
MTSTPRAAELTLETSEGRFTVTGHTTAGFALRPAVLAASGSKGYRSPTYLRLAADLNAQGIDVFFVHYISDRDAAAFESAKSARDRIAYYSNRMAAWTETIHATVAALRRRAEYRTKIGLLGVSLGAMPTTAAGANNPEIDAAVIVDGDFPINFQPRVRSMPPLLLIWGGEDHVFQQSTGIRLRDFARSLGGEAELITFPGQGHGFFLEDGNPKADAARGQVVRFFTDRLK